jgi:phosphoglycolate phosphatase-like HAD superfamily hydrolase
MSDDGLYTKDDLLTMEPQHDTLVCFDSDGCVFDTMEIKQKQCFHSEIIRIWGLEAIEPYVRESAEFVNLYSKSRGRNRFPCLVDCIELIRDRPEVVASGATLPAFTSLKAFIDSGIPMSNPHLAERVKTTGDQELAQVLAWSEAVNQRVAETVKNIPPFTWVRETLEKAQDSSDVIVVSQTPEEALVREWKEHGLDGYLRVIAGQELGTKSEHIDMAMRGRYEPDRVLMVGDALGDLKAARDNNACFYPINPAGEEASWERFYREAYDRFLNGTYRGAYEQSLVDEFDALLPETPSWKQ